MRRKRAGAARLIDSFGNEVLKKTFLSKMLSGHWQGTMALTEPQAGSSLTDIATTPLPTADGYYRIRGRKTFISAGDHDGAENIVHLMLARIDGAPAGPKGISLFVVPKMRLNEDGILASNDMSVSQIFHKMGYRGAPIAELSIGDKDNCRGYLLGRKVVMENGKAFALFLEEVHLAMDLARKIPALLPLADQLDKAVKQLQDVTILLADIAHEKGAEVFLADATLYLEFFGIVTVAWQWLLQAISVQKAQTGELSAAEADFYQGKFFTARYFFAYELPKISGLVQRLTDGNPVTVEMNPCFFSD
jgi:hypothetical protein